MFVAPAGGARPDPPSGGCLRRSGRTCLAFQVDRTSPLRRGRSPADTGQNRPSTGARPTYVPQYSGPVASSTPFRAHSRAASDPTLVGSDAALVTPLPSGVPKGFDASQVVLALADDAACIDRQQNRNTAASPLGNLRLRDAAVQPRRQAGVPEVLHALAGRRHELALGQDLFAALPRHAGIPTPQASPSPPGTSRSDGLRLYPLMIAPNTPDTATAGATITSSAPGR